jgi:hypothetical protein
MSYNNPPHRHIQLPDFRKADPIRRMHYALKIEHVPPLPYIKFEREVKLPPPKADPKSLQISRTLKESAIDVAANELVVADDDLLEYKGRKVLVYKPNQWSRYTNFNACTSGYRFHLTYCTALKEMRQKGRYEQYRATQRIDGRAPAYLADDPSVRKLVHMELCSRCRQKLKELGRYKEPFSYKAFFEQFSAAELDAVPVREAAREVRSYTPDHAEVSKTYREAAGWCCQQCQVDLNTHRELLHLHHVNGEPDDNSHNNLRVLCVDCHAQQPGHEHMKATHATRIAQIKVLRGGGRMPPHAEAAPPPRPQAQQQEPASSGGYRSQRRRGRPQCRADDCLAYPIPGEWHCRLHGAG